MKAISHILSRERREREEHKGGNIRVIHGSGMEWEHQSQLIQSNSRNIASAARSRTIIPKEAIRSGSTIELRGTYPMLLYAMQVLLIALIFPIFYRNTP